MTKPATTIGTVILASLLSTGCHLSRKPSTDATIGEAGDRSTKKRSDHAAWNAFGDPNPKHAGNTAGHRGRPGRNPDLDLPPVDTSRASAVSYSRVSVPGPYLAMTFDDGPHPTLTPRLLDILKERNIRATFFVVGTNARRYPQLIQRMVAEGHEVANHTVNHPTNMSRLPQERVRAEMRGCEESILSACGRKPRLMRPPGGSINSAQKVWIHDEFGYKTIMWSCDPEDWKRPGVGVVTQRLVAGAKNGAIILAHDIHAPTIAAVPAAMDGILAKGFRFVTVSQLLSMEPQRPPSPAVAASPQNAGSPDLHAAAHASLDTGSAEPDAATATIPETRPLSFESTPTSPAAAAAAGSVGTELPLEAPGANPG